MDLRLAPRRASTLAQLAPRGPGRGVTAHLAYDAAAGHGTRDEVLDFAERALAGRPFTRLEAIERPTLFWVIVALIAVDGAALADAALLDAEATAHRHRTRLGGAFVSFLRPASGRLRSARPRWPRPSARGRGGGRGRCRPTPSRSASRARPGARCSCSAASRRPRR